MSRPTTHPAFDLERFVKPLVTDRPGVRWWWQSPVPTEELVRELRAIAAAGFGEVEIAFSPGFWADAAQREAFAAILEEAERLGIGVTSTLGAAWPLQTPNTAAGTEHAAQELQYGVRLLEPGFAGTIKIPSPFDDEEGSRGGSLIAVTAARVVRRGPGPQIITVEDWSGPKSEIQAPAVATVLDADSLVDLTAAVTAGQVTFEPPAAEEWAVFGFWMRDTAQGVTSFIDRAAAVAATNYLDEHQIGAENAALLARAGTELFEDSLELNADSLFWAPNLLDRFQTLHGYDPTIYLPVLFAQGMCRYWVPEQATPDFDLDSRDGFRIRQDYYRLLTELYITDHLLVLQEWSQQYGLTHKAQVAYGQNLEPVRSNREFVRNGGRAEAESLNSGDRAPITREHHSWRFALDWQRALVGGAHQGGTTRISTELGAQFLAGYMFSLGDYKQMLDKEWAAGITKPFLHGFASQADGAGWPTQSRFFHGIADSWNDRTFPEWANWPALNDYWARGTVALEAGTPRTDIAIYRDGFLTTAARGMPDRDLTAPRQLVDAAPLEAAGYTIQFIDPIGLADPHAAAGRAATLYPHGPSYQALIIDERAIAVDAAEALLRAARSGVRVIIVGEPPRLDSGFAAGPDGATRVQAAIGRLLALPTVTTVGTMAAAGEALERLGVRPRVRLDGDEFLTQLRALPDGAILLAYNTTGRHVQTRLTIDGSGSLTELDPWTGAIRPVRWQSADGLTTAELDFGPLGLRFLRFSLAEDHEPGETAPPREWHELVLSGWSLTADVAGPERKPAVYLPGQGPGDWRTITALRSSSGTGVYTVQVSAGEDDARFAVDLGELAGSAIVTVGEHRFGPALTSDTIIDLGDTLRDQSLVQIEVRTPLRNSAIAHGVLDAAYSPTRATGLIGPVRFLGSPAHGSTPETLGE